MPLSFPPAKLSEAACGWTPQLCKQGSRVSSPLEFFLE
jgi:hypothetical protein